MKLLTESEKKRLKKLANIKESDESFLGFHVTVTKLHNENVESLKSGIQVNASSETAGGQGAGFYLFKNRNDAISRAFTNKFVPDNNNWRAFDESKDGKRLLVTVKFDKFEAGDIDLDAEISFYELMQGFENNSSELLNFYNSNQSLFQSAGIKFTPTMRPVPKNSEQHTPEEKQYIVARHQGKSITLRDPRDYMDKEDGITADIGDADRLGPLVNALEEISQTNSSLKQILTKIEQEAFKKTTTKAFKYDGKDKLFPSKLEIIENDRSTKDIL